VLVRVQGATLKLISSFGHFGHVLTCGRRLPASAKLPLLGQRLNFLSALNHDLCQLVNAVLSINVSTSDDNFPHRHVYVAATSRLHPANAHWRCQ